MTNNAVINNNKKSMWKTFIAAPHRMMFFAGSIQLILPLIIWSIELTGRYTELWTPLDATIPTSWAHAFIMLYGVFSFFIFGFLMTVYPRWMNGAEINKNMYISAFIWLATGMIIFEAGVYFSLPLAVFGLITFIIGWLISLSALFKVFREASTDNKRYEKIINLSLISGLLGAISFLYYLINNDWSSLFVSIKIGTWLFLLPVLFSVSHRMLPFFSSNIISNYKIYNPVWTLYVMLISCYGHFILELLHFNEWLFVFDLPLAYIALLHTFKWQIHKSFKDRLLTVLHLAFLWLGIAMLLFSLQSLTLLISGEFILAQAPLHALSIGFFSSLLIAMATRVSLGHSGRPLTLDTINWRIFLALQGVVVCRILADTQLQNSIHYFSFNVIASILWILCIGLWFLRFAPFYLTARADGRTG